MSSSSPIHSVMRSLLNPVLHLAMVALIILPISARAVSAENVILDTDMGPDCDDAGALAILHAMADMGQVTILGMAATVSSPDAAPSIDAINTYYGRPNLPIGTLKDAGFFPSSGWTQNVAANTATFPHDLASGTNAPDAVTLYRQILAAQPDASVVFIGIGPLKNLAHLVRSGADAASPLSGSALLAAKVKRTVIMGGDFSGGTAEWNFQQDITSAQIFVNEWPNEIVFSGKELGSSINSGQTLSTATPANNPVRRAYEVYLGGTSRSNASWDLTAVYQAVRGNETLWGISAPGTVAVSGTGQNTFTLSSSGRHRRMVPDYSKEAEIGGIFNDLMTRAPGTAPSNVPPTVNAGPDRAINLPATASLDGTVTDDGLPAGAAVTQTWSKVSGPGTVTFANANAVDTTASFAAAGTYVLRLTASDTTTTVSDTMTVTTLSIPAPWTTSDVGTVTPAGSAGESGGTFTLTGSGADIWGNNDGFRAVTQPVSGDCDLVARVDSLQNVDQWAKAGVMLRSSLQDNAANVLVAVTGQNGVTFQSRQADGAGTSNAVVPSISAPRWVKVTRRGPLFSSYHSADGVSWSLIGSETITMPTTIQACLVVTSHLQGTLCTAVMSQVVLAPASTSAITITSQPASVTVTAGQTATFAVVASGSGTLSYQWRQGTTNVGANSATLTITNAQAADAGSYTCVVTNGAGTTTSAVATLTVAGGAAPTTPTAPTTSSATSSTPTLSGTTEAGATVRIYDDGALIGTVVANGGGQWTWTVTPALAAGVHQITVTATNSGGNTSATSPATVVTVAGGTTTTVAANGGNGSGGQCGLGSAVAAFSLALMALMALRVSGRREHRLADRLPTSAPKPGPR